MQVQSINNQTSFGAKSVKVVGLSEFGSKVVKKIEKAIPDIYEIGGNDIEILIKPSTYTQEGITVKTGKIEIVAKKTIEKLKGGFLNKKTGPFTLSFTEKVSGYTQFLPNDMNAKTVKLKVKEAIKNAEDNIKNQKDAIESAIVMKRIKSK